MWMVSLLEPPLPLKPPVWQGLLKQLSQYPDFDRNGHGKRDAPFFCCFFFAYNTKAFLKLSPSLFTPQINILAAPTATVLHVILRL